MTTAITHKDLFILGAAGLSVGVVIGLCVAMLLKRYMEVQQQIHGSFAGCKQSLYGACGSDAYQTLDDVDLEMAAATAFK